MNTFENRVKHIMGLQRKYNSNMICHLNTAVLYHEFKQEGVNFMTGLITILDDQNMIKYTEHCWLERNGEIVEPSIEYAYIKKRMYETFKDFVSTTILTDEDKNLILQNIVTLNKMKYDPITLDEYKEKLMKNSKI
jgi:hypothetical protein